MKLFPKEPRLILKRLWFTRQSSAPDSVRMPYRSDRFCRWAIAQLDPGLKQSSPLKSLLPLTSPDLGYKENRSKLYPCVRVSQSNQSCQNFTVVLFPVTHWQSSRRLCFYTLYLSHKPSSPPWGKPTLISYPQPQPEVPMSEITHFTSTPFIQIRPSKPGSVTRVHAWLPLPGWHAGRQDPGLTEAFLKAHWNTKPKKCPGG